MLPRWLAHVTLVVGWLLTPLWAWAASYCGLWAGAWLGLRMSEPLVMLGIAAISAAVLGFGALWAWVRFMRRLPHLLARHLAPRASQEQAVVAAAD